MEERVSKMEMNVLRKTFRENSAILSEINNNEKLCFGDKERLVIKKGIVNNAVYARTLLRMEK